jgi:hypothetical protein
MWVWPGTTFERKLGAPEALSGRRVCVSFIRERRKSYLVIPAAAARSISRPDDGPIMAQHPPPVSGMSCSGRRIRTWTRPSSAARLLINHKIYDASDEKTYLNRCRDQDGFQSKPQNGIIMNRPANCHHNQHKKYGNKNMHFEVQG